MRPLLLPALIVAVLFATSCKPVEKKATKEDAAAIAKLIDSSINQKKPQVFNSLLNAEALADRIQKNSEKRIPKGFEKGMAEGLQKANLADQIIRAITPGGSYDLVKQYEKDGIQHLLYRMYSADGLNYHDFEVVKKGDKTVIADIYIYLAGDSFSSILGDLVNTMLAAEEKDSGEGFAAMKAINQIRENMNRGQIDEARRALDGLPKDMKNQKLVRIVSLQVASKEDDGKYLAELDEFEKQFPNEQNIHLLMVDAHLLHKNFDEALESINKLDAFIDKDPFLDYYRALVYNTKGEAAKAREHLEKLSTAMPDFADGQLELIANYLATNDKDAATPVIERYRKQTSFNQENLDAVIASYGN